MKAKHKRKGTRNHGYNMKAKAEHDKKEQEIMGKTRRQNIIKRNKKSWLKHEGRIS